MNVYGPIGDISWACAAVVDEHFEVVDCPTMGKRKGLDELRPAEDHKWPAAAKWIIGILGGLLGLSVVSVFGFYFTFGQRLTAVETDIGWIKSALKLSQAAQSPQASASIQEVTKTTAELKANDIRLDQGLVAGVGISFLRAAKVEPRSWPAVLSLLGYQSFLNKASAPKFDPNEQPVDPSKYHMSLSFAGLPPGQSGGLMAQVRTYGKASPDKSALLDDLRQPQVVVPGFERIFVDALGGTIALDMARMRHVVLMNAKIAYGGGPVSLDDVQFVNCTFNFGPTKEGLELAESILSAPTARFEHISG